MHVMSNPFFAFRVRERVEIEPVTLIQAPVRIRSFRIRYIFVKIRNKPFLRIRYILDRKTENVLVLLNFYLRLSYFNENRSYLRLMKPSKFEVLRKEAGIDA